MRPMTAATKICRFDTPLREGDKYFYHDDGQVAWGGS